jgi:putative PEP-CTERM system histidine kinase
LTVGVDTTSSTLSAAGHLLAATAYTLLAVWLLRRGTRAAIGPRAAWQFLLAIVATAAWAALAFTAARAQPWGWSLAAATADAARYGLWFVFLLQLLRPDEGSGAAQSRREFGALRPLAWLLGVAAVVLPMLLATRAEPPLVLARLTLFTWLALPVFGMILVEQVLRNVSPDARWGAKPLCIGLGCVFVFDIYHQSQAVLFGRLDIDAATIRGAVHALAVPLLAVAASRNAGWIDKLRLSPAAAFQSASLLLAGVYLIFVSAIGYYVRYVGGDWGRALQIGLLVVALLLLGTVFLSGSLRARLRVGVSKHLFRYRYDYRTEWLRFTAMLSAARSPQETGVAIVHGLADLVESPAGGLWTRRPGDAAYSQTARWNQPAVSASEPADTPFVEFLRTSGWIVDAAELRNHPGRYQQLALPEWWSSLPQPWLVVPLLVGDELLGFVVLDDARAPVEINWEVTDLLKTASRQAASYLAQMHATEALLEARKFDAFNRMSAFVVHDLKNIVTQLSLMLANAKRLGDNPEFQQDMLLTVESSLDKMRALMLQLREGEAPAAGGAGVDLAVIAQRIAAQAAARGRSLELEVADAVATRGHEQRIERVIGHMVQNAFDATPPDGRVWLRLARASGQARLEVGDTGAGMTQEFIDNRLFKPFQTTKDHGMGIGSYESLQYIQELGGSIQVHSQPQRGTVLTVTLPLLETRRESDLYGVGAAS